MKLLHPIGNDSGFALIIAMMIMVMLTLFGIFATNTSIFELNISGNDKVAKESFFRADGGTQAGSELIEENVSCPNGFRRAPNLTTNTIMIDGIDVFEKNFAHNTQIQDIYGASGTTTLADLPSDAIRSIRIPSDPVPANRSDALPHTNLAVWGVTKLMPGSALQMVAGYEGKGKGVAGGGAYIEYNLHSQHIGLSNSEAKVATLWRHVVGQEGTCNY